jgi:serine-type D-Ala-D-Ala carboxypeptidase/endopeptidase (penicillin-binding protein 4)
MTNQLPSLRNYFGRTLRTKLVLTVAGLLLSATGLTQPRLPDSVARVLLAQGLDLADVSAIVLPIGSAETASGAQSSASKRALIDWQSATPRSPASVMKLVSTYAALAQLGHEYQWNTQAFVERPIEIETLRGRLTLRGGGDPRLVIEDLTEWLQTWRRAGLRVIDGDLVIDESLFESVGASTDSFDGDPSQPYNVLPYPLLMNFKATKFVIRPGDDGRVQVTLDPPLAGAIIDNQVSLRKETCVNRASKLVVQELGSKIIRVSGPYSSSCGDGEMYSAVFDHRQFVFAIVKATWESLGGVLNGKVVVGRAQGAVWSTWRSPRNLGEIVKDINKLSNNLMTRQVLMQMGHEKFKQGATEDRARRAVQMALEKEGLRLPDLRLENGSGLSRSEQISVRSLAQLLTTADRSVNAQLFRESLPLVGVDGTMARRLTQSGVAGRAWIKTGSINAVSSLAGYVTAKSGQRYAVAFIVNSALAHRSLSAQDEFLQWVYDHG